MDVLGVFDGLVIISLNRMHLISFCLDGLFKSVKHVLGFFGYFLSSKTRDLFCTILPTL